MSESETAVSGERRAAISPFQAISAGIVAAGGALGLSEILSGLSRKIPSLVVSVAEEIVDITPGFIARWSIDTLGTAQKPALVWGIVIVSILLGAVLGWPSRKRWWVMPAGLVVFAVVGGWAAARNPLSSDGLGWMSGLLSGAFGIAVFMSLYALALFSRLSREEEPSEDEARPVPMVGRGRFNDRRRFVGAVGIMAGASLAGGLLGRWLRRRDTVEGAREGVAEALQGRTIATPTARATPRPTESASDSATPTATATPESAGAEPTAEATPEATAEPTPSVTAEPVREPNFDYIAGIAPLITPNEDFYLIDTALSYPQIDPADWSLRIHGMVDQEVEITFDELLDLGLVREQVTLSCVSNRVGGRLVGNAEWVGVPLATVLDQAGVQPRATQIVGRSVDRWTAGFPTAVALDGRIAMVAVQMNGEPLPISHGFPARLVVAGLYGYVSATKWLSDIELTTWEAFNGYWIPRGWAKEGPIKTQSRIDVPRRDSTIDPGPTAIAGVAWAPSRAIEKVEVQVNDEDWVEAELSRETTINSWRQWMVTWNATPGEHQVRVRATDGTGTTQTSEISNPAPDGATGWHTIQVRADEA
ncbi:MAG: molybdopterin-dependent oxidoreductase [Acidimicrobiia bacterium]|nr:molybdopterin-dependent oxidoreductase [Acidimicrobiia bacterium]MYE73773.1 molybdopterin-dependent oxidoreductase [Acidimicrobiia bacterium]MYJ63672.1 molybdopterin-dependent oxidoreductase [Acidimicrobiia bacterium]